MKWLCKAHWVIALLGIISQEHSLASTVIAEATPSPVISLGKTESTASITAEDTSATSSSQTDSTTIVVDEKKPIDVPVASTEPSKSSVDESKPATVQAISATPEKVEKEEKDTGKEEGDSSSVQTLISPSPPEEVIVPKEAAPSMKKILAQKEKLENILKEYEDLADKSGKVPQWTCLNHSFRVDDDDPALITVKKQLHLLGFFASSQKGSDLQFTSAFSKQLETAVKQFQRRHFLEPDGVIGRRTCIALNMTPRERIKKIKLNLERWKELEASLQGKYVLVNIPTYRLYAMQNRKIDLTQPVIVGMKTRETPIFTSYMNSVVLNPAWGVPVSIFIKDKLSKVLQDPHYLSKAGFTVMDEDGDPVTDSSVDWSHVSLHHFPYTVRQLPGKNNALGSIKFNLDNKEAIYLHGTPQKKLFHRIARPFSSGCVRLKSPQKLATWALKGTQYDNPEKLQEKIGTGHTAAILLKKPIPVYFTYITVWVDNKERVLFSDDPYNLDRKDYERFNL